MCACACGTSVRTLLLRTNGIKGRRWNRITPDLDRLEPCLSISTGSARKYYPTYRQTDNIYQTARDRSDTGDGEEGEEAANRFNHRIPRIPVSLPLVDQIDAASE